MKSIDNLEPKKLGAVIIIINGCWIWDNATLFYDYHYTSLLHVFQIPDWILILNSILGLVGILIGIQVIRGRIKQRRAIFLTVGMLVIGFLIVLSFGIL